MEDTCHPIHTAKFIFGYAAGWCCCQCKTTNELKNINCQKCNHKRCGCWQPITDDIESVVPKVISNNRKICLTCWGAGTLAKTWEDIEVGDIIYYQSLYIHCPIKMVRIYSKSEINDLDYWTIEDQEGYYYPMFKINFKGFTDDAKW